ncbi:serine hydrolase domain-containing protein [Sphingomonas crusticola]|uniref:serine hydrolase domain-containing protein n=1 Tax=Sphingomonas crusticola TaxID=1697973 RepID=UPI000E21C7E0|nr:serine hydrolase domain-containing protein [Sphingomonas crusticola]
MVELSRRAFAVLPLIAALAGRAKAAPSATGDAVRAALSGKATGAALVAKGGRILWRGAVADEAGAIATPAPDAVFDVLSIGKTFTAITALRLAETGALDLDKPIRHYLPELGQPLADIKIRHALNNDTGLPDYLEGGDLDPRTNIQAFAEIATMVPSRKGGSGFHYSNVNFQLLALLIERVSGQSFQAVVRRLIFEPARLRNTNFFGMGGFGTAAVANGYIDGKAIGFPSRWPNTWSLLGAAGIGSTVDDLYRLNRYFLAGPGLQPVTRARLLLSGAPTYGRGPYVGPDNIDISYGAGLFHWLDRKGRHVAFHGGDGDFGYNAVMFWRQEDDVFVAVLMNSRNSATPLDRGAMMGTILAAVG